MDTWVIILAIVNNVSMNMGVQICWNSSFVGSYGNSVLFCFFFLVLRNHHIVIHNGCTILHQHTQFPPFFFNMLINTCFLWFLNFFFLVILFFVCFLLNYFLCIFFYQPFYFLFFYFIFFFLSIKEIEKASDIGIRRGQKNTPIIAILMCMK